MLKKILFTIVLFTAAALTHDLLAVGMGMGMGPPNPPCGVGPFPPCPVPLDGGITLLAGAGIALAARKYYKKTE